MESNEQLLPLTPKEKKILEFIEVYIQHNGFSPTYKEIKDHFGFASFNSIQRYLKQLESKNYIQIPWGNQKRAITVLNSSSALLDSLQDVPQRDPFAHLPTPSTEAPMQPFTREPLSLPLYGRVAAGKPLEAREHDEYVDVPPSMLRNPSKTFALRVEGQSMIDDGIFDGDIILVQQQSHANNGELVVALVENEATVKRFYAHRSDPSEKKIELRPANTMMTSMWYNPVEVNISGIVIGLMRKF